MNRPLARFAAATLAFNVLVIAFGAVVRATGSGSGCGANWPTCGGDPLTGGAATAIEFTHRATSGIALLLVGMLVAWVVRVTSRGEPLRKAAYLCGLLIVNEALIGAALVLFEWVAEDRSAGRVVAITLHLVNTFFLLAALTITTWLASGRTRPSRPLRERRLVVWGGVGLLLVAVLGAITALGDTLFPADSLGAGIRDDLSGALLVRLRWVHPLVAVAVSVGLIRRASTIDRRPANLLVGLLVVQLVAGVVNVLLLAPLWMQVLHLTIADVVWITFVVTSLDVETHDRATVAA